MSSPVSTIEGKFSKCNKDGKVSQSLFLDLADIVVDKKGYLYVADIGIGVRRIAPNGKVTTLKYYEKYHQKNPSILVMDRDENLFVYHKPFSLWKTDLKSPFWKVTHFRWCVNSFVADNNGDIYFCGDISIMRISNRKEILFAGHSTQGGYVDGPLLKARFRFINCLYLCKNGDILIGEDRLLIRKISNGLVSTVVSEKEFGVIESIVEDWKGRYFFNTGSAIYMINPNGEPTIVIQDIAPRFITIDITGIYFTERITSIVKKIHFSVTWTPGI
jgi:hypothetical protein